MKEQTALFGDSIYFGEDSDGTIRKYVKTNCNECGKEFKVRPYNLRRGKGKFCSWNCTAKHRHKIENKKKKEKAKNNPIKWSNDIAYLVGLITSDGCLIKGKPKISFTNKDMELINAVKEITRKCIKEKEYKIVDLKHDCYSYSITSRKFYYFLEDIGLTPDKSLTIGKLDIPNKYFWSFLLGEIDGDGSIINNSNNINLEIYSGSKIFLKYLKNKISDLCFDDCGKIYDTKDVYRLYFPYYQTNYILQQCYSNSNYCLTRKKEIYDKYSTYVENIRKAVQKSKVCGGEVKSTWSRKLNKKIAVDIIKEYYETDNSYKNLAEKYNVCFKTIGNIINCNHWTTSELSI